MKSAERAAGVTLHRAARLVAVAGAVVLLAFFAVFGVLSHMQPYMVDDLSLLESIEEHSSAIGFVWSQYTQWTGRPPVAFLTFYALQYRVLGAVVNALVFAALVVLAFRAGWGRWPRPEPVDIAALVTATGTLWFGVPAPDESMMWITGTVTYLWQCLPLAALLGLYASRWPAHVQDSGESTEKWRCVAVLLLGGIVGLASLQTAAAAGVFLLLWFVSWRRQQTRSPLLMWTWSGVLGLLGGIALQLLSPGNAVRMSAGGGTALSGDFIPWLVDVYTSDLVTLLGWSAALVVITMCHRLVSAGRLAPSSLGLAYIMASLGALVPFSVLMPYAVPRAQAFTAVLLVFAALALVGPAASGGGRVRVGSVGLLMSVAAVVLALGLLQDVMREVDQAHAVLGALEQRDDFIRAAGGAGIPHVRVPPLSVYPRRVLFFREYAVDPENWFNRVAARRFGVESIGVTTTPEAVTRLP